MRTDITNQGQLKITVLKMASKLKNGRDSSSMDAICASLSMMFSCFIINLINQTKQILSVIVLCHGLCYLT